MHGLAVIGVVLILAAVIGMGAFGAWGMPGTSWMPRMGWGHMGSGSSTGTGTAQAAIAGAREVAVGAVDFGFRPAEIRIKAGQPVNLRLVNRGGILHDVTIPALNFQAAVQPGQQTTVGLPAAAAGTYEFYCSVPGHREAGMVGRLIVTP